MREIISSLIVVHLAVASPCRADITQTSGPATLTIGLAADRPTIALADTIRVTLTIDGSPALRVQAPLDLPAGATWTLIERSKAERVPIGPERVRWRIAYRLAPLEPGELRFAFPDVKFRDGSDTDQVASWQPITCTVTTEVKSLEPGSLRGVPDIEKLPPVPAAQSVWPLALVIGLLVCGVLVIAFAWRHSHRRRPPMNPPLRSLYELHRLVALKLPERGRGERFVTLLSLIVRRYLGRQHQLPARRQTTFEFLERLQVCESLDADDKQFLHRLLMRLDTSKFAGLPITPEECRHWADATEQFLTKQAGQLAQASPTLPVKKTGQTG